MIDLDASGDLQFKDASNPSGKTLKTIQQDISDKYPSANPNGYETPSQLNSRDTANRSRTNHTGSQAISTVTNLQNSLDAKYDASNPSGFETPSQLNARDTANRSRANHTNTQLSSTISNFVETVRSTALAGIVFTVNTAITSTDSILTAMGKLQEQITMGMFHPKVIPSFTVPVDYHMILSGPVTVETGKQIIISNGATLTII